MLDSTSVLAVFVAIFNSPKMFDIGLRSDNARCTLQLLCNMGAISEGP